MPWTPILNWTSPEAQAETFCQIYQRQHKTAFKPPHTSLLQRYDPSRHPEGLQPSSRYFSSPVLLSQCHRAERVMLRRRKRWGATERAMQVTDVLKWDKYSEQSAVWRVIVKLLQSSHIIKKTSIGKCAHTELCNITNPCHVFCNNC